MYVAAGIQPWMDTSAMYASASVAEVGYLGLLSAESTASRQQKFRYWRQAIRALLVRPQELSELYPAGTCGQTM